MSITPQSRMDGPNGDDGPDVDMIILAVCVLCGAGIVLLLSMFILKLVNLIIFSK